MSRALLDANLALRFRAALGIVANFIAINPNDLVHSVQNIVVARERVKNGTNVELVDFAVFEQGPDNDTDGISILAVHDLQPHIDPRCSPVDPPVWFVCYWK